VVQIVAAATPGSSADILALRSVDGFTRRLGEQFIIIKIPRHGVLSTPDVARGSRGGGYRLLLGATCSRTVEALTQAGYNVKSFTPAVLERTFDCSFAAEDGDLVDAGRLQCRASAVARSFAAAIWRRKLRRAAGEREPACGAAPHWN